MDQVAVVCRRRHLSRRTEEAYRFWIRRYILFHHKQHPRVLGTPGIVPFINHLATAHNVAASTQSQALNALLFLYRDVLAIEVGYLDDLRRVQRPSRIPVVLTIDEVRTTLALMRGVPRLMAELLYGAGLRVAECVTLRVKDIDFRAGAITVRSGKGAKDRTTLIASDEARAATSAAPAACRRLAPERRSLWAGLRAVTRSALPQVSQRRAQSHVAVRVSVQGCAPLPGNGTPSALARVRVHHPACIQAGVGASRGPEARQRPHAEALIRHALVGKWHGHPHDPVAAWTPQPADHDDLHPR